MNAYFHTKNVIVWLCDKYQLQQVINTYLLLSINDEYWICVNVDTFYKSTFQNQDNYQSCVVVIGDKRFSVAAATFAE